MKRCKKNILTLLIIFIFNKSYTCDCLKSHGIKDENNKIDLIVIGSIVQIDPADMFDSINFQENFPHLKVKYKLKIEKVVKGNPPKDFCVLYSGNNEKNCGFNFLKGQKYLVYASIIPRSNFQIASKYEYFNNIYLTNNCTKTQHYDSIKNLNLDSLTLKKNLNKTILPIFKNGGENGQTKFINDNLKFPTDNTIDAEVELELTIDSIGNVINVKVNKGAFKEMNNEAIRVAKLMTFNPGTINGKAIEMKKEILFQFSLDD